MLRLHIDCPHLGIRGLATLLARVEGFALSPSQFARFSSAEGTTWPSWNLCDGNARGPSSCLHACCVGESLVWVLGVVPVWLMGVVDMHSSRLIALRPVAPTSEAVVAVLQKLFLEYGRPSALMTDNGGQFVAARFRDALRLAGVRHLRIRPGHPWTNGKTERVFRTVKELQRFYAPVLVSFAHVQSFCADVLEFYNHCRPHSSHWGLTPDERDSDRPWQPVACRQAFFDGQLLAYRFT